GISHKPPIDIKSLVIKGFVGNDPVF
ncbi:competence protein ComK, partial [Bacillus altitudinis]